MMVTVRKPKRFQEMLTYTLLTAFLGVFPGLGLAAEPPAPAAAKSQPLSEAIQRQIGRLQLQMDLKELVQVRSELRKMAVELDVLQAEMKQQPDTVNDEAIELAINQDLAVKDKLVAVKQKRDELAQLEKIIANGRNNPLFKAQQIDLQALEKDLAARRRKLRPVVEAELKQKSLVEVSTRIKSCQQRITIAKELEKKLVADIRQLSGETGGPVPANEDRLRVLEKEVKDLKEALEALKRKGADKNE